MQAFALFFFLSHTLLEGRFWKYLMQMYLLEIKNKMKQKIPQKHTEKLPNKQKKSKQKNPTELLLALVFNPFRKRVLLRQLWGERENLKISHFIFQFLL